MTTDEYKNIVSEAYSLIRSSSAGAQENGTEILTSPVLAVLVQSMIDDSRKLSNPTQLNG